jgi:large subunit ribosomal protein L25
METISLSANNREITGKQVKQLRTDGIVPAVVYGHGTDSRSIGVDQKIFDKVLAQAGESTLVDLEVESDKPVKVLIQEVQRHPLSGNVVHVDFRQVKMSEKLEADIELKIIGEAPAVKVLGGIMITNLNRVTVSCLPTDLVPEIEVDVSGIENYGDNVKVGDLTPPNGIEFVTTLHEIIVVVNEPVAEEEEEIVPVEGEAGEEGEAATAPDEGESKDEAEKPDQSKKED